MTNVYQWKNTSEISSRRFTCGHCGGDITSNKGFMQVNTLNSTIVGYIYICHSCQSPTYLRGDRQSPGPKLGTSIENLPKDILDLHNEIRDASAIGAYTAAVMAGRKLLMHIAVECGAETGQKFIKYVDYLVNNHYAPPNSKAWVDKIRQIGNEANHEIIIMGPRETSNILKFIEMLLRFNYEFKTDDKEDAE